MEAWFSSSLSNRIVLCENRLEQAAIGIEAGE